MNATQLAHRNLLTPFSTCDLADALQRLNIPSCIPNATPIAPTTQSSPTPPSFIGPAHTVQFIPSTETLTPQAHSHHVDILPRDHVMVIAAPLTHPNAVWGGIMSARAKAVGAAGVIVDGRVRDILELRETGLPVFATNGTSVLGAAGYVRPVGVGETVTLGAGTMWPVVVRPGDWIVADVDGVVRVPVERVEEVVRIAAELKEADGKCLDDIAAGSTIADAFKKHRGKK
ncbi:RraA-like protein [Chytridium lagenaria]|nr:RraA-like protein [Chytridium lagenaria]